MKKFIILIQVFCFLGCATSNKKDVFKNHPLSIVQGVTSESETIISILSPASLNLEFYYGDVNDEKKENKKIVQTYFREVSPSGKRKIYKIHLRGLSLAKEYYLMAVDKASKEVVDERNFKALDLKMESPKIGVASCFDDRAKDITPMWKEYLNKNTDINFFIGDNSYADKIKEKWGIAASKEQLWLRYAETFEKLYFYHSSYLTPTLYLWDDHDYGLNNGGREFKYKKEALKVFKAFYPLKEIKDVYRFTNGAGSVFKAFKQRFIFIDARYFRSEKTVKDQTQWGKDQERSVFNELNRRSLFTWLIQGDQYFGAYHPFESYEKDRPSSFLKMLGELKRSASKILFVSGDRHLTEIMKIKKDVLGYETYEVTSSGMHAKVFPGSYERNPNPNLLVGKSGVYNFSIIEPSLSRKSAKLKVTAYGLKSAKHYEKEIEVKF